MWLSAQHPDLERIWFFLQVTWGCRGIVFSALDFISDLLCFSLDKKLYTTSLSTQVYKWVLDTYCWGNPAMASHPVESSNSLSCSVLQEPFELLSCGPVGVFTYLPILLQALACYLVKYSFLTISKSTCLPFRDLRGNLLSFGDLKVIIKGLNQLRFLWA